MVWALYDNIVANKYHVVSYIINIIDSSNGFMPRRGCYLNQSQYIIITKGQKFRFRNATDEHMQAFDSKVMLP